MLNSVERSVLTNSLENPSNVAVNELSVPELDSLFLVFKNNSKGAKIIDNF